MTEKIADILGLSKTDPWDQRSTSKRERDAARAQLRDLLHSGTQTTPAVFVDPPDSESFAIDHLGRFHRLMVANHKLSEVLVVVPGMLVTTIARGNHPSGCWLAYNNPRLAQRVKQDLDETGWLVIAEVVDQNGDPMRDVNEPDLQAARDVLSDRSHSQ